MIRDTSAQDRMVEVKPNRKRRLLLIEARAAGQLAGDQQPLF